MRRGDLPFLAFGARSRPSHHFEQLGWRLVRIWSTDFFLDPESTLSTLDVKLRGLLDESRAEAALETSVAADIAAGQLDASEHEHAVVEEGAPAPDVDGDGLTTSGAAGEAGDPFFSEDAWESPVPVLGGRFARGRAATCGADAALNPARFYEPDYRPVLQRLALAMIAAEGPITFDRLSSRIARLHGFQRTGRRISEAVWAAAARRRRCSASPDGEKAFWAEGREPEAVTGFRVWRSAARRATGGRSPIRRSSASCGA